MSKRLSVDLELNAQGYKKGIDEAKRGTAEYTNATRDLKKETEEYIESFGPLRKQLAAAKKEAQNLAAQFSALGKAERESEYGQELSQSLQIAIQKAAELQDVLGDTNEAITRAASDTQGWDAMKDAFDIGKDLATAYAGAVAKLTGNEKALKDMVATVAMAQGAANAAIKIGNALQKQSNIMIAIGNVQLKAKAIAEELATKKTIGATAAQRVFNAVAKANPYVLLATVAIAAATAIGTYMLATNKATTATERLNKANKEMHSVTIQGQKDAQSEITKLKLLYDATQDTTLSINARQSAVKQLQEQYPAYFGNLDKETIMVGNASSAYQQLVQDILAVAMAKAYEKKISSLAEQNVELEDQIEKDKELVELGKKAVENAKEAARQNSQVNGVGNWNGAAANISKQTQALNNNKKAMSEHEQQLELNKTQMEEYQKKIFEASDAIARLNANNSKSNTNSNSTKQQLTELEKYNKQLEDLEKKKQNIKDPFSDEGKKQLADINKEIARLAKEKIVFQVGIGDKIDQKDVERALINIKDEAERMLYKISIGVDIPEDEVKKQLNTVKEQISQYEAQKLEIDVSTEEGQQQVQELQNKIDALIPANNTLTLYIDVKYKKNFIDAYENDLKEQLANALKDYKLAKINGDEAAAKAAKDIYDKIQGELNNLNINFKPEKVKDEVGKIMKDLNTIDPKYDFSFLPDNFKEQADTMLERLNEIKDARKRMQEIKDNSTDPKDIAKATAALESMDAEYNKLTSTIEKFNEVSSKIKERNKDLDKFNNTVNEISNVTGAFNSIVSSINSMINSFDEASNAWEKFISIIEIAMTIMNAVSTVMTTINTIQDIFNVKKALTNSIVEKEAAAHAANATAQTTEAASTVALASTETAAIAPTLALAKVVEKLAAAQIFAAHAYIPFAGVAIGAANVGVMEGILAAVGAFAQGGVVGGNSYSGDKLLARVNSNEMIFNTKQQKRLYDIANGLESPAATPQSFTISSVRVQGRDLVLAIKNELKTTGQKL